MSIAGKREFSPVILAGFVAFGVTTGAILLNSGVLLSEQALGGLPQSQAAGSPIASSSLNNALTNSLVIDERTRLLLNAALVFLGLGALLIGVFPLHLSTARKSSLADASWVPELKGPPLVPNQLDL